MNRRQLRRKLRRERRERKLNIVREILDALKAAAIAFGFIAFIAIGEGVANWICAL